MEIDWGAVGVYGLILNADKTRAVSVIHMPTDKVAIIAVDIYITEDFELKDNRSDTSATCVSRVLRSASLPMSLQHMKGQTRSSPWLDHLRASTHARVAAEKQTKRCQDANQAKLAVDVESFVTPLKEKQREATKRAREALAKRNADSQTKRRVPASQAAPAPEPVVVPAE